MVKLHLFRGWENLILGIGPNTELGHLYEDTNDQEALCDAIEKVGGKRQWIQSAKKTGLMHFDLWGKPLEIAKKLFRIVTDQEFAEDVARLSKGKVVRLQREVYYGREGNED